MPLARHLQVVTQGDSAMGIALRVAFATNNMKQVNQHFGSAQGFVIYQITTQQATLLEVAKFEHFQHDGNEDKLAAKIDFLRDCAAIYCQAIGGSAIRQLLAQAIQPIKVAEDSDISQLIQAIQQELQQEPLSGWLAAAVKRQQNQDEKQRFDKMEAEGWEE